MGRGVSRGEGGVSRVDGMGEGACCPFLCPSLSERERARKGWRATRERGAKGASEAACAKGGGERMERGTGMVRTFCAPASAEEMGAQTGGCAERRGGSKGRMEGGNTRRDAGMERERELFVLVWSFQIRDQHAPKTNASSVTGLGY